MTHPAWRAAGKLREQGRARTDEPARQPGTPATTGPAADVLRLQRTAGNQAVQHIVQRDLAGSFLGALGQEIPWLNKAKQFMTSGVGGLAYLVEQIAEGPGDTPGKEIPPEKLAPSPSADTSAPSPSADTPAPSAAPDWHPPMLPPQDQPDWYPPML